MTRTTMRRALLGGATLALMFGTAGCGSGMNHGGMSPVAPTVTGPSSASFNDDDVMFAQMMIPHHQQAVEMSTLAETRAQDPELKHLAAQIKAAQQPEITMMTGWLTAWGQPTSMPTDTPNMGHGHGGVSGMMAPEEMTQLAAASGIQFDRLYASMMIAHHDGAIQMARDESFKGANPDARALAKAIIKSQTDEVATLQAIVQRLG